MIDRDARRDVRLALPLACSGSVVVIMDATIVPVPLPDIRDALGFSAAELPWVVNAYTLAFAGFLLLGGRCADVFGQRRMYIVGATLFTVARLGCGAAGSPTALLAARAVQGLGGALLIPVTLSLLTTTYLESDRRTRALATWSAVGAIGAALGPVLGGAVTQWLGWRWVFLIGVPIGMAIMAGGALMTRSPRPDPRPRLDLVGAALVTAGLVGVVAAVMRAGVAGWSSGTVLIPLTGGLAVLALFLVHQERWTRRPLVPLAIFRHGAVGGGNVVMFLLGLGFFASPVLLSLYLREIQGFSAWQAGLGYGPVGVAMFLGARAAAPLTVRLGPRRATVLCCAVGAVGGAGLAALTWTGGSYLLTVAAPGAVFGLGTAAAFTPITVAATTGIPARQQGLASGLLNTVRQASGAIGLAALSTVSTSAIPAGGPIDRATVRTAHGFATAFGLSAGLLVLAAVAAAVLLPTVRRSGGHG